MTSTARLCELILCFFCFFRCFFMQPAKAFGRLLAVAGLLVYGCTPTKGLRFSHNREWIQWDATRRLQANKLVRALHAWKHSSLLRCWAAWLAWVEERREAKARLGRCIGAIVC